MKLTIKTLDQKTFHVEFDDTKTVWELKEALSKLPEIAVQPELQQVIYAGRVLVNDHVLQSYSIDERKFLVVMAKKAPTGAQESTATTTAAAAVAPKHEEKKTEEKKTETSKEPGPSRRKSGDQPPTAASPAKEKTTPTPAPVAATTATTAAPTQPAQPIAPAASNFPTGLDRETLVQNISSMGYPESEVRHALLASCNNPDRAIEYLIEGIPEFPEIYHVQAAAAQVAQRVRAEDAQRRRAEDAAAEAAAADAINPLAFLRQDARFNQMRRVIQQRPELVSTLLAKIGETNPALLTVIRENQEEFLRMLNENVDEGPDAAAVAAAAGDIEENVVEVVLNDAERLAIERLVGLGFPRDIVVRAYIACEKNEEQTADFLCRHMEEN